MQSIKSQRKKFMPARRAGRPQLLIAAEQRHAASWFFLSFASDTAFLGACIVRAHGILTATRRASALRINPGGEVMSTKIPRRDLYRVPPDLRNRLLTEAEVRERLEGKGINE